MITRKTRIFYFITLERILKTHF